MHGLTLGFAQVQRMVGDGDAESLPGIYVSSGVVVTLGVPQIRCLVCRSDRGAEDEEEEEREESLLFHSSENVELHCADLLEARSCLSVRGNTFSVQPPSSSASSLLLSSFPNGKTS